MYLVYKKFHYVKLFREIAEQVHLVEQVHFLPKVCASISQDVQAKL